MRLGSVRRPRELGQLRRTTLTNLGPDFNSGFNDLSRIHRGRTSDLDAEFMIIPRETIRRIADACLRPTPLTGEAMKTTAHDW
jgi:hypothetical protein